MARKLLRRALVAALGILTAGSVGIAVADAAAAAPFKVLAFYNGTWDAAHIDFDSEARDWFPRVGAQYGFTWEATTDWSRLNAGELAQYKVIMFLDDAPSADRRAAFQQYMQNGGAWMGFHVSAFTTDANSWSWYHNTFLGSGNFATNTWGGRPPRRCGSRTVDTPPPRACPRRSPPRSASGTRGAGTCGRTRTSTCWPRSTRPASRSAPTRTSSGAVATTR
nr:hypothetical protein GCM10020092_106310 [Actinoplanes digitatis]